MNSRLWILHESTKPYKTNGGQIFNPCRSTICHMTSLVIDGLYGSVFFDSEFVLMSHVFVCAVSR